MEPIRKKILIVWCVITAVVCCLGHIAGAGQIIVWGSNSDGQRDAPVGYGFAAISAGPLHCIALKFDGTLVGWGKNDYGQTNVLVGNDYIEIAAGSWHGLAIKQDNSLVSWGRNNYGQTDVPAGNDFVEVAAGSYHSLARRQDGSLAGWGWDLYDQATVPDGDDYIAIAAGPNHSLALKQDGKIVGWGRNDYDQLNIPFGTGRQAIDSWGGHCLAIEADNSLLGWGRDNHGQATTPEGTENYDDVAAGAYHSLALKDDGTIVGWGDNGQGQINVPDGSDFTAIAAGAYHSLAISEPEHNLTILDPNGGESLVGETIYTISWASQGYIPNIYIEYSVNDGADWLDVDPCVLTNGDSYEWLVPSINSDQCLLHISDPCDPCMFDMSNGTFSIAYTPRQIDLYSPNGGEILLAESLYEITWYSEGAIEGISLEYSSDAGGQWTPIDPCSLVNSGSYQWSVPAIVSGQCLVRISDFDDPCMFDISGETFSIVSDMPGFLDGWGNNSAGQIDIPQGGDFLAVAAGKWHGLALKTDGSIVGWGDTLDDPCGVSAGFDFVAIAAGDEHNLAIKTYGSVVSWGSDASGLQSQVPDSNDFIAIDAGGEHSLALRQNGSIVAWGNDYYGQATAPDPCDFVAIAAGGLHSIALKDDGSIVSWGDTPADPCGVSAGSDFLDVAAGAEHSVALKENGAIVAWGSNSFSQTNAPAGNDFVAISAGSYHNIAIRQDGSAVAWGRNNRGQLVVPEGNDFITVAAGYEHSLAITLSNLAILTPLPGELLLSGEIYNVTWRFSEQNSAYIELDYSTDNGDSWYEVDPCTANTGSYNWQLPPVNSDRCLLKITDCANQAFFDKTDAAFTIYQCTLRFDATGDCVVDLADFAEFAGEWLMCGNPFDSFCVQ